eukprot:CAMPEP_0167763874 /NCGR_PEP_ID=MMETSP0110_2-20121227/13662_1 /TAXON_ID=629695 /ORGANISM="Gymnochlora sp., Strain CCMP2014" /LENGTH=128 /DNA_ID=CAMNT_0007651101 /DNA_START=324 /DNA_END=707 /DNA_ORIENTATION=-
MSLPEFLPQAIRDYLLWALKVNVTTEMSLGGQISALRNALKFELEVLSSFSEEVIMKVLIAIAKVVTSSSEAEGSQLNNRDRCSLLSAIVRHLGTNFLQSSHGLRAVDVLRGACKEIDLWDPLGANRL